MTPAGIVLYQPDIPLLDRLLHTLNHGQRRVFIFINGDAKDQLEPCLSQLSNAHIIHSKRNLGLAIGLNKLVAAAQKEGFEHILLFDQDSTPAPELPENLARRFAELQALSMRPAVLGPRLLPPENEGYRTLRYKIRSGRQAPPNLIVDFIPTSGSLISIAAWRHIGSFREDYFIANIDVEWCYRAWHHGYECILADDIKMEHRWGHPHVASKWNAPQIVRDSDLRTFYYIRNAVHTLQLPHMPWRAKIPQLFRLTAQSVLFIASKRGGRKSVRLIKQAVGAGRSGRLGPAPDDLTTL